jgi:hypothetical protein
VKAARAIAHLTPEARVMLEAMIAGLELIALKGVPLSVSDEVYSWGALLAASEILSEFDSSALADEVVTRLRAAIDNVEYLAPKEGPQWTN